MAERKLTNESCIREWQGRVAAFLSEAHTILGRHETSPYRLVYLDDTRKKLAGLSLLQSALFDDAINCVRCGAFKAAHVMAWAAFIDFLEEKLASDGLQRVVSLRPKWAQWTTIDELSENVAEYQLIEVARDAKLFSKAEMKTVHGHLSKRNECAHPTTYSPGMNEAIGYISELLTRVEALQGKTL